MRHGIDALLSHSSRARMVGAGSNTKPLSLSASLDADTAALLMSLENTPVSPQWEDETVVTANSPGILPAWLPDTLPETQSKGRSRQRPDRSHSTRPAHLRHSTPHEGPPANPVGAPSLPTATQQPAASFSTSIPQPSASSTTPISASTSPAIAAEAPRSPPSLAAAGAARHRYRAVQRSVLLDAQDLLLDLQAQRQAAAACLRRHWLRWRNAAASHQAWDRYAVVHRHRTLASTVLRVWRTRSSALRTAAHQDDMTRLRRAWDGWQTALATVRCDCLRAAWARWRAVHARRAVMSEQAYQFAALLCTRRSLVQWRGRLVLSRTAQTVAHNCDRFRTAQAFTIWRHRTLTQSTCNEARVTVFRANVSQRRALSKWRRAWQQHARAASLAEAFVVRRVLCAWRRAAQREADAVALAEYWRLRRAWRSWQRAALQQTQRARLADSIRCRWLTRTALSSWRRGAALSVRARSGNLQLLSAAWVVWRAGARQACHMHALEAVAERCRVSTATAVLRRAFWTWRVRGTLRTVRRRRFITLARKMLSLHTAHTRQVCGSLGNYDKQAKETLNNETLEKVVWVTKVLCARLDEFSLSPLLTRSRCSLLLRRSLCCALSKPHATAKPCFTNAAALRCTLRGRCGSGCWHGVPSAQRLTSTRMAGVRRCGLRRTPPAPSHPGGGSSLCSGSEQQQHTQLWSTVRAAVCSDRFASGAILPHCRVSSASTNARQGMCASGRRLSSSGARQHAWLGARVVFTTRSCYSARGVCGGQHMAGELLRAGVCRPPGPLGDSSSSLHARRARPTSGS